MDLRSSRPLLVASLLAGLCGGGVRPPTAWGQDRVGASQARQAERDRLWDQARWLLDEGQTAQAVAAAEEHPALERQVPGAWHRQLAQTQPGCTLPSYGRWLIRDSRVVIPSPSSRR